MISVRAAIFFLFIGICTANGMFVETYWESFSSFPFDYSGSCSYYEVDHPELDETLYGFSIADIPTEYVKVVNIAFAAVDPSLCRGSYACSPLYCGLHLFRKVDNSDEKRLEDLKEKIQILQSRGVLVKLAYGGEEWGNSQVLTKTKFAADILALQMSQAIADLGLDGLDLTQKQGYGTENMNANDESSVQLYLLQQLRKLMPNKLISYTFPGDSNSVNFPFRDVVQYGHGYVNTINVFRANIETITQLLGEFKVPASKIVWGLSIGCNQLFDDVDVERAIEFANTAREMGLAGVMTWSLNRDTNHRTGTTGECNPLQTGQPDGSFLAAIYKTINP